MYWVAHLGGGVKRVNHAAAVVGNNIYSFGGFSDCTYADEAMDVHVLNIVTLRWVRLPPGEFPNINTPFQRYGHTAITYGTKIYIWGGLKDDTYCNNLYCFDTLTFKWTNVDVKGEIPGPRDGHSACLYKDKMYIFGGYEENLDSFCQDVYVLDLTEMRWSYVITNGTPPSERDFHTAIVMRNRMYIFGGRSNDPDDRHNHNYPASIIYMDLDTNTWYLPCTFGEKPVGRRSHSAFIYNDSMYIFGGFNSILGNHYNAMHCFNPVTNNWTELRPLGELPCKRRRQSCAVINNKMYMFGGTSPQVEDGYDSSFDEYSTNEEKSLLKHNDDLHILDFKPSLRTLCIVVVNKYDLDYSNLPVSLKYDIIKMSVPCGIKKLWGDIANLKIFY